DRGPLRQPRAAAECRHLRPFLQTRARRSLPAILIGLPFYGCKGPREDGGRPQPAHATAVVEVKERHPSERQVCEISPGLYPPRSIFCTALAVYGLPPPVR